MYEFFIKFLLSTQDPNNHKITQWSNTSSDGVFSEQYVLPPNAEFGQWCLQVGESSTTCEKYFFHVSDRDLQPTFEIFVTTKQNVSLSEGKIIAEIYAKYPNGRYVNGVTTVTVISADICLIKEFQLNGKCEIEFEFKELKLKKALKQKIEWQVVVTDSLKSSVKSDCVESTVYNRNVLVKFVNREKFTPGCLFKSDVVVDSLEKRGIDSKIPLNILWKFHINGTEQIDQKSYGVNQDGSVKVEVNIPFGTNQVKYTAKYLEDEFIGSLSISSKSELFLKANVRDDLLDANKEIFIDLKSSENLTYFTYQIFANHSILSTRTIATNGQSGSFVIQPTTEMLPRSKVMVFYVTPSGNYLYDILDLDFGIKDLVTNDLKIELIKDIVKPCEFIDVKIKANQRSRVFLMAVDEKVYVDYNKKVLEYFERWDTVPKKQIVKTPFDEVSAVFLSNYKGGRQKHSRRSSIPVLVRSTRKPSVPEVRENLENILSQIEEVEQIKNHLLYDTWIFEMIPKDLFKNGEIILRKRVPEIMTNWMFTAFTVDYKNRLQITQEPKRVEVFKSFYTIVKLPYSIKFGETLTIPVEVYNNSCAVEIAEVDLLFDDERFEVIGQIRNKIKIPANDYKITTFTIKPKTCGDIPIKIKSTGLIESDDIEENLLVEFDGVKKSKSWEIFVDHREKSNFVEKIDFDHPPEAFHGSSQITLSISNDIMNPLMGNLSNLRNSLSSFGDEELVAFDLAMSVTCLNYLSAIEHDDQKSFYDNLMVCYQHQLKYKQSNGSFNGDVQYTAFVLRFLWQASKYIEVDKIILKNGLEYLKKLQKENGSFTDCNSRCSDIRVTAIILLAFLESDLGNDVIEKGLEYILDNVGGKIDLETLGLVIYIVLVAKHPKSAFLFINFQARAKKLNNLIWWECDQPINGDSRSSSIEMTSYGLLSYLEAGITTDTVEIMRWLLKNRNKNGGFFSLDDTIIASIALSKIGASFYRKNNKIKLSIRSGKKDIKSFEVGNEAISKYLLPNDLDRIEMITTGHGCTFVKVVQTYPTIDVSNGSLLDVNVSCSHLNAKQARFDITMIFNGETNENCLKSNPFFVEFSCPSGYAVDVASLRRLNVRHMNWSIQIPEFSYISMITMRIC